MLPTTFVTANKKLLLFVFFALLTIILLLAIIERTIGIRSGNILFLFDNARDLLYVQKLVIDHKPLLIGPSSGGLQGYFHGVFWYYLLAIPFFLGHGNPIAITTFVAILSLASIIATFFIVKKIGGIYAATLATIIYSFSSFSVATAKFPWNPYPIVWLMPFYFLGVYLFTKNQRKGFLIINLLTSLFIHFEAIYGICLLPTLLFLYASYVFSKKDTNQKIQVIGIAMLLFMIPLIPTLLFDVRHHFLIISNLFNTIFSGGANITHAANESALPFAMRLSLRTYDLYNYTINSLSANIWINILFAVAAIFGYIYLLKTEAKPTLYFINLCLITLVIPFLFFLTLKYSVWSYYWIGNAPLYALVLAYVIGITFQKVKYLQVVFMLLIIGLLVIYSPWKYLAIWQKGELQPGPDVLQTQEQIVRTIYQDAKNNPFSTYVSTPPVYDYRYRYLFAWAARKDHIQQPQDTKQHTLYLIVEYMPSDPQGKFFKKHVVHTNIAPIKTWTFPGIIVEKIITKENEQPIDPNYFPQL